MHTLKTSSSNCFEKTVLMLASIDDFIKGYSNLALKDSSHNLVYQMPLAGYSKSRARVMEILK